MTKSKKEWDTKKPPEDGSLVSGSEVQPDYTSYYKNRANGMRIHLVDKNGLLVGSRLMTPEDVKHIVGEERQRVVEMIEGMVVEDETHSDGKYVYTDYKSRGYNQALSDLQSKLEKTI